MIDPIQAAVDAAKANAANVSQEANANMGNAISTQTQNTAVGAVGAKAVPFTADDMMAGSMAVRDWLKVNEFGLYVGNDKTFFEKIPDALIDFSLVQFNMSVKYGNPAVYEKTYNGMTSVKGKPWNQVLEHALKMGSTGEFKSADIPFELQNELVSEKAKGTVLAEAGECLGHSLSTTSWANFARLLQECKSKGVDTSHGRVLVDIGYMQRSGKGNTWGVISFSNVRPA